MGKTKEEIRTIILNNYANERAVAGLPVDDPAGWSTTSIKGIWVTIMTNCWYLVEQIFDIHIEQVNYQITELKAPTLRWMRNKVLQFQYGSNLVADQDYYNNDGLTEAEIAALKIIVAAAVDKEDGIIKVKAVKLSGGDWVKLSDIQRTALISYIEEVFPPINFSVVSVDPDKITTEYDVYYDPKVLMPDGTSILKGNKPVEEAFRSYLRNLEFNGWFIKEKMEEMVKKVPGIVTLEEKYTRCAAYSNPSLQTVSVVYKPFSGFIRYYNNADLKINYIQWQ